MTSTGKPLWVKTAGVNSGTNKSTAKNIELGPNNEVVVIGDFDNAISFDETGNNDFVNTGKNSWIAQWTNTGLLQWVKPHFSGSLSTDECKLDDILIDKKGDILAVGKFTNKVKFENLNMLSAAGGKNTFMIKYSKSGKGLWSSSLSSVMDIEGKRICFLPSGKVIMGGSFRADAKLGSNSLVLDYYGLNGVKNAFITMMDAGLWLDNTVNLDDNYIEQTTLKAYPNPSNSEMTLTIPSSVHITNLKLIDVCGKAIYNQELPPYTKQWIIDIHHIETGVYFLVHQSNTFTQTLKINKQ
jgi:hypothetical protein